MRAPLTAERLRELLTYDQATGIFVWRVYRSHCARAGDVAGSVTSEGYIAIRVDNVLYYAQRLAWLYVHGEWPRDEVDHKDTVRTHNWIENLRDGTKSFNMQNLRRATSRNRTSGLLGVHWSKAAGRFTAQIKIAGKSRHLGLFDTAETAHIAYVNAKREHHAGNTL